MSRLIGREAIGWRSRARGSSCLLNHRHRRARQRPLLVSQRDALRRRQLAVVVRAAAVATIHRGLVEDGLQTSLQCGLGGGDCTER